MSYLLRLTLKLHSGVMRLQEDVRKTYGRAILSARTDDGGFRGRRGGGDLYYTAFALRALFLLGALEDAGLRGAASDFLARWNIDHLRAADLASYSFSAALLDWTGGRTVFQNRRNRLLDRWNFFRRDDGCYATSEKSAYSSTYQTFLAAAAFEALGAENDSIPVEPILRRQRPDGGFVELEKLHRSGTNPTAAAVGFLKMRGAEPDRPEKAVDFLLDRQTASGGFQANTMVPVPDLLSGFTALVALADLGAENRCDRARLRNFVESMRSPDGGFFGADWDRQSDVEYTFYGMGLEALL